MKKIAVGFVALLTLVVASMANGASSSQEIYSQGIWCKSIAPNGVACVRMNGKGYTVGLSRDIVLVMRNGKKVFARYGN